MSKAPLKQYIGNYIRNEIRKSNETQLAPEFQLVTDSSKPKTVKVLWTFVLAICVCVCCYQTYERIEFYLSEPVTVNVAVDERESINFPEMILTNLDQDAYLPFWPVDDNKKHINNPWYCANPMGTLLKESATAKRNLTKLWLASNMTHTIKYLSIEYNDKLLSKVSFDNGKVEYSFNNTYFRWTEECAMQGFRSVVTIINPIKVGSRLNVVHRKRGLCKFQLFIMWLKHELIPFRYGINGRLGTIVIVTMSTKQYNFVNRRVSQCRDFQKVVECYRRCITKKYIAINCSFPFLPPDENLRDCASADNGTDAIDSYNSIKRIALGTSATITCGCIKSCTEIVSHISQQKYLIDDNNLIQIQFDLSDPYVTVFDQKFAYDAIKLAIDIGGNIGLLIGLSLLNLIELNHFGVRYLQRKIADRAKRSNVASHVKDKCLATLASTRNHVCKPTLTANKTFIRLKITISLLCSTLTLYMISQNILFYVSDPSIMIVDLTESGEIYHPNFILCGENAKIHMWRQRMSTQSGIPACQLHFLDLLDLKKPEITLDTLWSAMTIILDELTLAAFQKLFGSQEFNLRHNLTTMHTGICHEFTFTPWPFVGETAGYLFSIEKIKNTNCTDGLLQLYLRPHNAKIHSILLSQRHLLANFMGRTLIRSFKVQQMNTKRRPCVDTKEFEDCTNYCKEEKMKKLIKCRLPFMENLNYPPCINAATAKESYDTYLKIAVQTDALKECGCFPACNTIVYQSYAYYDEPDIPSIMHCTFPLNNLMEIFIEKSAYSFVGMVCDIGNNIGLSLGLSVLTMLHRTGGMFSKFFVPRM